MAEHGKYCSLMNKTYDVVSDKLGNIIRVCEDGRRITTIGLPDCDLHGALLALNALGYQRMKIEF